MRSVPNFILKPHQKKSISFSNLINPRLPSQRAKSEDVSLHNANLPEEPPEQPAGPAKQLKYSAKKKEKAKYYEQIFEKMDIRKQTISTFSFKQTEKDEDPFIQPVITTLTKHR